jgi:hypothetical protein
MRKLAQEHGPYIVRCLSRRIATFVFSWADGNVGFEKNYLIFWSVRGVLVLVTVCGIHNSAELGVRIQKSAESTDPEVILWNPDAVRAESADRGRISLWEQASTRSSAVCTVYENGSPAGEEPPNAKFLVLHARCSHYDGCWTLERSQESSGRPGGTLARPMRLARRVGSLSVGATVTAMPVSHGAIDRPINFKS